MRKIVFSCVIVLVVSCEVNNVETIDTSLQVNDVFSVKLGEAMVAASNAHKTSILAKGVLKNRNTTTIQKKAKNAIAIPDSDNPSYYIVNYQEGGWAVISADKRIEPVMAYAENGKISLDDQIPGGLIEWFKDTDSKMKKLKTSNAAANTRAGLNKVNCPVELAWAQALDEVSTPCGGGCEDQYSNVRVAPLTPSVWDQGCGYNDLAPQCNNPGYCNRMPVGCVPLAMAQVMYYWKKPGQFNWSAMVDNVPTPEAARLIYEASNGLPNFTYGCTASRHSCGLSATCDGGVTNQFKNKFGYSSASHGGYDYNILRANLNAGQPVMLWAYRDYNCFFWCWPIYDAHVWVCDGYSRSTYYDCSTGTGYESNMLSMNWGWGSGYSAWVREYDWAVNVNLNDGGGIKNFNYWRAMYYNIRP